MDNTKTGFVVDGFAFHTNEVAEKAAKELQGVKFIRSKTDMDKPEIVLQVYHKILAQGLFETEVGICFLRELQEYLIKSPAIDNEKIKPLDMAQILSKRFVKNENELQLNMEGVDESKKAITAQKEMEPQKSDTTSYRTSSRNVALKAGIRTSIVINIGLLIVVIAMFAITLTSNNPTIVNYEKNLKDKYAGWEEELTQREAEIRIKENELRLSE
ncbi:hypothetical protein LQZ18_10115 [Lachnospiraceae bacterium ZAX-1]